MDLAPARWIWFPSARTLPNTFVLFRRSFLLQELPVKATGWITADSRYRLTVNGRRVQWGPAPCDPRSLEVDPFDITSYLQVGENVIGVEVLYYGHGDGTWAMGKPGLILQLTLEHKEERQESIVTDSSWLTVVDRAHKPGQHKRWFLRALQEEFDARLHPQGWNTVGFVPDERWLAALELNCQPDKPPMSGTYHDYLHEANTQVEESELRVRELPLLVEHTHAALRLAETGTVKWRRDPNDWFDFRTPDSFVIAQDESVVATREHGWEVVANPDEATGLFLTFEWAEEMVGWPCVVVDAPEGTIVEIMCQESHDAQKTLWLETQFFNWTRLICREGRNVFEAFDYESFRWLQLHIRNASRPVRIELVGLRRRFFPWPHAAQVTCAEPALQRLFQASINTLYNSAQETVVDGMARERQQYSGDAGHQLHAIRYTFGEIGIPRRFLRTYSMGQTHDGYFLDCWPGHDRLSRIAERQIGATPWGPLLDHSVGFVFDNWHHYLETGDVETTRETYPRLERFVTYLATLRDEHGLVPADNLGIPTVWIDHEAYWQQRHKQCAWNLYIAAMLKHAFVPLARLHGEEARIVWADRLADEVLAATIERFWCQEREVFVNNLPWLAEEAKGIRLCDRSLATALLFDQCPSQATAKIVEVLANCPPELGVSYPANANWRYWGLARYDRMDVVVQDLRERWATMDSVIHNNTLQEFWEAPTDSKAQWSHCPIAPLFTLYMDIAGIRPAEPGFAKYEIRPQLADIAGLAITAQTAVGAITFEAEKLEVGYRVTITLPDGGQGVLVVPEGTEVDELQASEVTFARSGRAEQRFDLVPGQAYTFWLGNE